MVVINAKLSTGLMTAFSKPVPFTCLVRNELNGQRQMNEVVYSENADGSKGVPYMPRPFPVGTWELKMPGLTSDPLMAPYFTPTTAWQMVDEWGVVQKDDGEWYTSPTGRMVQDWGYGVHASSARESDGCLHIVDGSGGPVFIDAGTGNPVSTKEDYVDFIVNQLIAWLRNITYEQPPQIQVV